MQAISPLLQWFGVHLLKSGKVPRHVAFVADGARRFGKKYGIPVQENHEVSLFGVMLEVIDWCLLFGIPEYSILMYSFGNYYRPKDEVSHWIDVLRHWLVKCINNWKTLQKKGIRFNFYGKLRLIPDDINALMGMLQLITRNNKHITVNMAMGYTSRHELSSVTRDLVHAVHQGLLQTHSLKVEFFNECLFAVENRAVDLLIRTSGFKRVSNFLCWQTSNGSIFFDDTLWPEFNKFHFMKAIFYYQASYKSGGGDGYPPNKVYFTDQEQRFLNQWKLSKIHLLLQYCISEHFFPQGTNINQILNYNYETLYRSFETVYPLISKCYE